MASVVEGLEQSFAVLARAEAIVGDARERMLNEKIHPLGIAYAFLHHGISKCMLGMKHEDRCAVYRDLEEFIAAIKEVADEHGIPIYDE